MVTQGCPLHTYPYPGTVGQPALLGRAPAPPPRAFEGLWGVPLLAPHVERANITFKNLTALCAYARRKILTLGAPRLIDADIRARLTFLHGHDIGAMIMDDALRTSVPLHAVLSLVGPRLERPHLAFLNEAFLHGALRYLAIRSSESTLWHTLFAATPARAPSVYYYNVLHGFGHGILQHVLVRDAHALVGYSVCMPLAMISISNASISSALRICDSSNRTQLAITAAEGVFMTLSTLAAISEWSYDRWLELCLRTTHSTPCFQRMLDFWVIKSGENTMPPFPEMPTAKRRPWIFASSVVMFTLKHRLHQQWNSSSLLEWCSRFVPEQPPRRLRPSEESTWLACYHGATFLFALGARIFDAECSPAAYADADQWCSNRDWPLSALNAPFASRSRALCEQTISHAASTVTTWSGYSLYKLEVL
jgi:hypothetical protein